MAKQVPSSSSARPRGLPAALAALKAHFGKRPLFTPPLRRTIPMRHRALGELLGGEQRPGLPTGCFVEVLGSPGSGKTTLTFALIDAVINQPEGTRHNILTDNGVESVPAPRKVYVADFEQTLDLDYLRRAARNVVLAETDANGKLLNARDANVYVHQPETLEEGVEIMLSLIASGEFGLCVLDSIAAMQANAERDRSMDKNTVGELARGLGKMFRKSVYLTRNFGCTVVMVNQWRQKVGVVFGDPRHSPGGNAPEYYDAIKLDLSGTHRTPYFEDGKVCRVKAMKNKVTGLRREVTYHIGHGVGLSAEVELIERAASVGLVETSGLGRPAYIIGPRGKRVRSWPTLAGMIASLGERPSLFADLERHTLARGGRGSLASGGRGFNEGGD